MLIPRSLVDAEMNKEELRSDHRLLNGKLDNSQGFCSRSRWFQNYCRWVTWNSKKSKTSTQILSYHYKRVQGFPRISCADCRCRGWLPRSAPGPARSSPSDREIKGTLVDSSRSLREPHKSELIVDELLLSQWTGRRLFKMRWRTLTGTRQPKKPSP